MKRHVLKKLGVSFALGTLILGLMGCSPAQIDQTGTEEMEVPAPAENIEPPAPLEESDIEPAMEDGITKENLPVLDGATANLPYYQGMVGKLLHMDDEEAKKYVLCSTTGGAFENLINGTADMIFVSYPSKDQEQDAADHGVTFEYHHILTGAFVFFVNKDNPVDNLTVEQLRGIYTGEITNWKEVGGEDVPIVAYQREEGSGSQNGLYRYVVPKEDVMKAPTGYYFNSMEGILEAFGDAEYDNSANAIGYSYYYYVCNIKYNDKIKLLKIEGVEPGNETIGNGTFPFCNPTLAVVRKGTPEDSKVYEIIDWIMSDEGEKLAEELGYVANRSGNE